MIRSVRDQLDEYIPTKNWESTLIDVETSFAVGQLKIIRENEHSYILIVYFPDKDTKVMREFCRSGILTSIEEIKTTWFMWWLQPGGFLR